MPRFAYRDVMRPEPPNLSQISAPSHAEVDLRRSVPEARLMSDIYRVSGSTSVTAVRDKEHYTAQ